ncbi:hypothetical protein BXZ70DRAFT_112622 [Cristinia sonorae]|uniref:Uncharacterized protein n=1 Tax=Cristinia sonorae TaxID=1940300 RepID=A0A8K0UNW6_9AGAR|nr:hypothetical protein BXZ70DRAFT_112622 [Cristinia sonorae]
MSVHPCWTKVKELRDETGHSMWQCKLCRNAPCRKGDRKRHEDSVGHQLRLKHFKSQVQALQEGGEGSSSPPDLNDVRDMQNIIESGVDRLVRSLYTVPSDPVGHPAEEDDQPHSHSPPRPSPRTHAFDFDWGIQMALQETDSEFAPSAEASAISRLSEALSANLATVADVASDEDNDEERADGDVDSEPEVPEPMVTVEEGPGHADEMDQARRTRPRIRDDAAFSRQWYPWSDKIVSASSLIASLHPHDKH